jgi:predicted nucleic-acid-binding protein
VTVVADTNVWARALLNDDVDQSVKARRALADARAIDGIFVPVLVMAELAWVLRSKWERTRVLTTLESLLHMRGVMVESPVLVGEAITATSAGNGGFTDELIAQVGFANGAAEVITFDSKFARNPRVKQLK